MAEGETLEEVSLTSEVGEELKNIIHDSHLDADFDSKWRPAKIQLIYSKSLQAVYEEKREECLVRGRTSEELADQYGFTVENSASVVQSVCAAGFTTHDSDYNALGYSSMGVYLCRHADVCLRHAIVKFSGSPVVRLLVCKYMLGRHTTAIPRVASSADFIRPTQGFDCHISVLPPSKSDSLQTQFDRSQVYLYDINALLQPLLRPRQLLPYAIVTYTVDGVEPTVDDVEPLSSEVPPQLHEIIQRINAKADGQAAMAAQRSSHDHFSRIPAAVSAQNTTTSVVSTISVTGSGSAGKPISSGSDTAAECPDANLQRVIAQINARLESQERNKQLALQNLAAIGGAGAPASYTDVYPTGAGRVIGRNSGDQVASGLGVLVSSAPRADAGSLGIAPVTAVTGAGYTGGLAAMAAAQPKLTVPAANVAAASGGYVALAAGRSAPFAVAPELVGASSALAGVQYPSSAPIVSASPYLRTLPGVVDATGIAAVDPASMVASQQLKYIPCQSQGRDVSLLGAASASGLYPLQSVVPADAVGAGYTLVNSGAPVKRSLNDVMLYMVDKRPRYY